MGNESWSRLRVDDLITLNRSATVARLLAGVVHEVNNALQVIGGTTELLQNSPDLPEPVVKGLQRIHAQNTRAALALAEVMTFFRQTADARGRVNIREVVSRAISLRSYAISRARLTIAQHAPAEGRLSVDGSAPLLQQALLNLIVNAEQSLAGRAGGAIVVDVEQQDGWIQVRVSDNGAGIDPAVSATMFEPFVTTRSRDEASGLGLTVARAIAESHRGTLTHETRPEGASFVLRIPAAN
jgi:two-component system C4-dicarboxylate transport sensor histidine kinase DctB